MCQGIDRAGKLCEEGKCIGIGEIGRPHFEVSEEVMCDSNEILVYGMAVAGSIGVPVVVHTESTTPSQCNELVLMGKKVGLDPGKIVKHFSPPLIKPMENYGLFPSVLCTKKNVEESLKKGTRFFMETDYIDDLRRPGAVLGPKTVPRRTKMFLDSGMMTEEQAYRIHVENPQDVYNIALS
jgi:TatD-related deoxyribonuclease